MKKIILLVFSIIIIIACNNQNDYYNKNNIRLLDIHTENDTIKIYYRVPLETLYYPSGIDYSYNLKNNHIDIGFVRQKIKTKVMVMIESKLVNQHKENNSIKKYHITNYLVKIPINKEWALAENILQSIKVKE